MYGLRGGMLCFVKLLLSSGCSFKTANVWLNEDANDTCRKENNAYHFIFFLQYTFLLCQDQTNSENSLITRCFIFSQFSSETSSWNLFCSQLDIRNIYVVYDIHILILRNDSRPSFVIRLTCVCVLLARSISCANHSPGA